MDMTLKRIFRDGFYDYKNTHGLSIDQHRAAQAIMSCQSDLGHEEWICLEDGHCEQIAHSCRHRSCPRCNGGLRHDWLEKTKARLLPCDHFHVVFTLPHELNILWQHNREWCSDHLFKAAAETLQQLLADERYLGADVGIVASLHTWGRTLSFHPHVHLLVTGGGRGADCTWRAARHDFLLPVGVIKAKFRGKWLAWLNAAYAAGDLQLPAHWSARDWIKVLSKIAKKNWNVRIQGAYRHGTGVTTYLSRYVRGGPIKDHRILAEEEGRVMFRYRDHRDGKSKTMKLSRDHFIGRVLSHVPVSGRHLVRYYGLYVPGAIKARNEVRRVLNEAEELRYLPEKPARNCPKCGGVLFHHLSARRPISSIRYAAVQPGVEADHETALIRDYLQATQPPPFFLGRAVAA